MFCNTQKVDQVVPSVKHVLQFLQMLYEQGLGYSAINTTKSAVSSVCALNDVDLGTNKLVQRFMRRIFVGKKTYIQKEKAYLGCFQCNGENENIVSASFFLKHLKN